VPREQQRDVLRNTCTAVCGAADLKGTVAHRSGWAVSTDIYLRFPCRIERDRLSGLRSLIPLYDERNPRQMLEVYPFGSAVTAAARRKRMRPRGPSHADRETGRLRVCPGRTANSTIEVIEP
jgi:hypothetical protein